MKIHLISCGPRKIAVVKAIRQASGLGLLEAKIIADSAPSSFNMTREGIHLSETIEEFKQCGAVVKVDIQTTVIDRLTAASYISTAEIAMQQGNITECRNCLRSALRLLGGVTDEEDFLGSIDLR